MNKLLITYLSAHTSPGYTDLTINALISHLCMGNTLHKLRADGKLFAEEDGPLIRGTDC